MKIDVFCHILPKSFHDRTAAISGRGTYLKKRVSGIPVMVDLDLRFRLMDSFGDYVQVPCLATPPIEALGTPAETPELARIANDGLADMAAKHPDRFPSFVASLPMNNPGAAVAEAERAVRTLGAAGVQLFSNVGGLPLDAPQFAPLFELMAILDVPIWIHPTRGPEFADYATEDESLYELWWVFGWPYESSVAMARIVFAGYFDRFPNLKVLVHHLGGMVPHFAGRLGPGLDVLGARTDKAAAWKETAGRLKRRPYDYFRMFYGDTAVFGAQHALECGVKFFGADHVLFATDMPFDPEKGPAFIRETIRNLEAMPLAPEDRRAIYEGNARRLLRLKLPEASGV